LLVARRVLRVAVLCCSVLVYVADARGGWSLDLERVSVTGAHQIEPECPRIPCLALSVRTRPLRRLPGRGSSEGGSGPM